MIKALIAELQAALDTAMNTESPDNQYLEGIDTGICRGLAKAIKLAETYLVDEDCGTERSARMPRFQLSNV